MPVVMAVSRYNTGKTGIVGRYVAKLDCDKILIAKIIDLIATRMQKNRLDCEKN